MIDAIASKFSSDLWRTGLGPEYPRERHEHLAHVHNQRKSEQSGYHNRRHQLGIWRKRRRARHIYRHHKHNANREPECELRFVPNHGDLEWWLERVGSSNAAFRIRKWSNFLRCAVASQRPRAIIMKKARRWSFSGNGKSTNEVTELLNIDRGSMSKYHRLGAPFPPASRTPGQWSKAGRGKSHFIWMPEDVRALRVWIRKYKRKLYLLQDGASETYSTTQACRRAHTAQSSLYRYIKRGFQMPKLLHRRRLIWTKADVQRLVQFVKQLRLKRKMQFSKLPSGVRGQRFRSTREAAAHLRISPATIMIWIGEGFQPPTLHRTNGDTGVPFYLWSRKDITRLRCYARKRYGRHGFKSLNLAQQFQGGRAGKSERTAK